MTLGQSGALMVGKNRQQTWQQRTRKYQGQVHLFIYKVRHSYDAYAWTGETRFCTVFALGSRFEDAERIAQLCAPTWLTHSQNRYRDSVWYR